MDKKEIVIGVIYCGYNQIDNIKETLTFWNSIKIEGYKFVVSVISVPFAEYKMFPQPLDGSTSFIRNMDKDNIQNCIFDPEFISETTARTLSLKYLTETANVDIIWQVDSDEFYTLDNVQKMLEYIDNHWYNYAFNVNFKNYIYDGKHYLDDFCVPKINVLIKLSGGGYHINPIRFITDNQILFGDDKNAFTLKSIPIPKEVALVKHYTWMHKNGKSKVQYQLAHFGDCGFRWNEQKQELELDEHYFARHGYTTPNILKEE